MTIRYARTPIGENYSTTIEFNKYLASRFEGKDTLYAVFNFKPFAVEDRVQIPVIDPVVRDQMHHFKSCLNYHLYKNVARRHGKRVDMCIAHHTDPHHHAHALIACENEAEYLKTKSFCETFALRNRFMNSNLHIELTRNIEAAQIYNGRFGIDSIIIF